MKKNIKAVLDLFDSCHGDEGKDAVKAIRYYARVTNASADELARYASAVAGKLEEIAGTLR